jgi:hypothetical protein
MYQDLMDIRTLHPKLYKSNGNFPPSRSRLENVIFKKVAPNDISPWIILAHKLVEWGIFVRARVCVPCAADFCRRFPNDLREMTGGFGEARIIVVVLSAFVVPCNYTSLCVRDQVERASSGVAIEVLAILSTLSRVLITY